MLTAELIRRIEEFVYQKPRSMDEIARHIGKNWRTADRYIEQIERDFGTIAMRVFRGGTKGALKIVYWASVEKASPSVFQQHLENEITRGRKKEDFSAFDIFQHIEDKKKKIFIKVRETEENSDLGSLKDILLSAKKQIIIFSGNLSFINFKDKDVDVFAVIQDLVKRKVSIKVICRVDIGGLENIEKMLSLNHKYGKEVVEIRHREQPLRAIIIDNTFLSIKEIQKPTGRPYELKKKMFLFYEIRDKEWIEWLARIFWKMFSSSVDAHKRLEEINKLNLRYSKQL